MGTGDETEVRADPGAAAGPRQPEWATGSSHGDGEVTPANVVEDIKQTATAVTG